MKTENHVQNLHTLIDENELSSALKYLRDLLEQTPHLKEIIHQTARFKNITNQIRSGTVSHEDATVTENQIRISLLDLISEIEIQQENPEIKKELGNAISISIVNSKNVVVGDISGTGDVHVGDIIIQGDKKYPKYLSPKIPRFDANNASNFVGRKTTLQKLHDLLEEGKNTLLLNGLGGIGKTSVARMYCHIHEAHYDHFVWLNITDSFENALTLAKGLHQTLDLVFEDKFQPKQIIDDVFQTLNTISGNNLLIIDNANESLKTYTEHLPPTWKVLVTSREKMDDRFTEFPLGVLDLAEAKLLFTQHYNKATFTDTELEFLCEAIGYHTLTLELLARTLEESLDLRTISELTQYLQSNCLDAEELQEEVFTEHSKEEKEIYSYLLQAFTLAGLDEDEKWILLQFAVLPPIAHEGKDLLNWIQKKDTSEYKKILKRLNKKGWVERKSNSFKMHRLIQTLIRYQVKPTYENCKGLVDTFEKLLYVDQKKDNPSDKFQWIEYGEKLCDNINDNQKQLGSLNDNTGLIFKEQGNYSIAVKYYLQAISIAKELNNVEDLYNYQNNLAIVYRYLGHKKEAAELLETVLVFAKNNFGEQHNKTANFQSNLSNVYADMGRYQDAAQLLETALVNLKNFDGDHQQLILTCQSNLASVYINIGRYKNAVDLLESVLISERAKFGEGHPNVANCLNNLAHVYLSTKEYKKAKDYFEKTYLILIETFREEHPITKRVKKHLEKTKSLLK